MAQRSGGEQVYAFILGPVAITVRYWEERDREVEGGARIEVRRVTEAIGDRHRPGAAGWRIEPVASGGLWRSDILTVISRPGNEVRYHHHPEFRDGDVGRRVFDPEMTADPVGFTIARLADLPQVLLQAGAPELAEQVNRSEVDSVLPAVRDAIHACLAQGATGHGTAGRP